MADYLDVVYDENLKPYTSYPAKLEAYLFRFAKMQKGMNLLEPGVGRGEHLRVFKNLGLGVHGLDISPKSAEMSPDLNIATFNVDDKQWPYQANSFDIVYSKSFIEHLHEPEKFFLEVFRILKPGGIILTLTPDWEVNYKTFFDDYTHVSPFSLYSLINIQKASGFENIKAYKLRQLPIVWRFPILNHLCAAISPFIPVRTKIKFLRWSRELMLIGIAQKPMET